MPLGTTCDSVYKHISKPQYIYTSMDVEALLMVLFQGLGRLSPKFEHSYLLLLSLLSTSDASASG